MIEKGKAERRKIEICLIKLKWSSELKCGNKIRSGDAFGEPALFPDNVQKSQ
jgi:hypothetical protein